CKTSIKTSTVVLGNLSKIKDGCKASLMTFPISISRLEGAGFFRSVTEKGDMWYLHRIIPVSVFARCFGCTSRGPKTPTRILLFPNSIYAEPSAFFNTPTLIVTLRVSSIFLPSHLIPFASSSTQSVSRPPIIIHFLILT
ncbi:hypothetical protein LCGC14_3166130, partial [marine sediment metagenome]